MLRPRIHSSNGIGTIRREYLDQLFFWNAVDLARKLREFRDYYNVHRAHRALAGSTPVQRAGAPSPAAAALTITLGSSTARVCFRSRLPRDYDFATHTVYTASLIDHDPRTSEILGALKKTGGVYGDAAKLLGIDRSTLWRRMRRLGIA